MADAKDTWGTTPVDRMNGPDYHSSMNGERVSSIFSGESAVKHLNHAQFGKTGNEAIDQYAPKGSEIKGSGNPRAKKYAQHGDEALDKEYKGSW